MKGLPLTTPWSRTYPGTDQLCSLTEQCLQRRQDLATNGEPRGQTLPLLQRGLWESGGRQYLNQGPKVTETFMCDVRAQIWPGPSGLSLHTDTNIYTHTHWSTRWYKCCLQGQPPVRIVRQQDDSGQKNRAEKKCVYTHVYCKSKDDRKLLGCRLVSLLCKDKKLQRGGLWVNVQSRVGLGKAVDSCCAPQESACLCTAFCVCLHSIYLRCL